MYKKEITTIFDWKSCCKDERYDWHRISSGLKELIIVEDLENGGEEMSKGSGGPGVLNSRQEFFLTAIVHSRQR